MQLSPSLLPPIKTSGQQIAKKKIKAILAEGKRKKKWQGQLGFEGQTERRKDLWETEGALFLSMHRRPLNKNRAK